MGVTDVHYLGRSTVPSEYASIFCIPGLEDELPAFGILQRLALDCSGINRGSINWRAIS